MGETQKAGWWARQWEEIRPHFKWRLIEYVFGGGVFVGAYALVSIAANQSVSLLWAVLVFVVSFIGYGFISLYLRSQRDRIYGKSTGLFTAMTIYLPIVLGLGFCVWAYFVGSTIYRLNREAQSLRSNLDLYVKPRTVSEEQITAMAASLSKFDSQDIAVVTRANDAEAANYMGQIMSGLVRGGWKITKVGYQTEQMNQGIMINVEQSGQPQNPDPKHPTPEMILKRALEEAKITVNGGGGAYNRQAYSITIAIGPRPFVIDSAPPPPRPQIPPPPGWQ